MQLSSQRGHPLGRWWTSLLPVSIAISPISGRSVARVLRLRAATPFLAVDGPHLLMQVLVVAANPQPRQEVCPQWAPLSPGVRHLSVPPAPVHIPPWIFGPPGSAPSPDTFTLLLLASRLVWPHGFSLRYRAVEIASPGRRTLLFQLCGAWFPTRPPSRFSGAPELHRIFFFLT
ncbi:hypothetical protein NDU88_006725 [Pleurodeles waltl]|uniref:Uncharacterized protein n=1 Tax=Pleurodeles waltl TaxID=8319 RepID=A0AAV7PJ69_PLEWA|nr:hypothetical protein NDU88_006725 [Pleurodeles waltl]